MPKVSINTVAYNAEQYISEAIESVLNQTFQDWEYIIVNDGSTDNTEQIIKKYLSDLRIKYFYQENQGVASARNNALSKSNCKYVAVLDADDIWLMCHLKKTHDFLLNNKDYVAVGTNAQIIDMYGTFIHNSSQNLDWNSIKIKLPGNPFFHSSVLFKKDVALKCNGYEKLAFIGEDVVLFNRMSKFGKLYNLNNSSIKYRIEPSSIVNKGMIKAKKNEFIEIKRKLIDNVQLSVKEIDYISSINLNIKPHLNFSHYFWRIGKKYTLNNFNRKRALYNFFHAYIYNPLNFKPLFLALLLLLPKKIIMSLYSVQKTKNE